LKRQKEKLNTTTKGRSPIPNGAVFTRSQNGDYSEGLCRIREESQVQAGLRRQPKIRRKPDTTTTTKEV